MDPIENSRRTDEPLVEPAPEEAVIPALIQSAHPVEWTESNEPDDASDES
jgi:hypothetical protein